MAADTFVVIIRDLLEAAMYATYYYKLFVGSDEERCGIVVSITMHGTGALDELASTASTLIPSQGIAARQTAGPA